MNARTRAVRACFLASAFLLALAASPVAVAQGAPGSDTAAPTSYGGPIPLALLGDDPDPVPLGIVDPGDSRVVVLDPSRNRVSVPRLWIAACFVSGLPALTGNPQTLIGLDMLSAPFRRGAPANRPIGGSAF